MNQIAQRIVSVEIDIWTNEKLWAFVEQKKKEKKI